MCTLRHRSAANLHPGKLRLFATFIAALCSFAACAVAQLPAVKLPPAVPPPPGQPAAPASQPAANDKLDQQFVGVWEVTVPTPNGDMKWNSDLAPNGHYVVTFLNIPNFPPETGTFEAKDGKWSLVADVTGRRDGGTYKFSADDKEVAMVGTLGPGTWKRIAKASNQKPGAPAAMQPIAMPPFPNLPPANVGGGMLPPQPLAAGALEDFPRLRAAAQAMAVQWNAQAQCFRFDAWGAYHSSLFQPAGARFLFCAGNAGLEVRADNNSLHGIPYTPNLRAAPQALPADVLLPEDALRRLWDLAPTVSYDQIYLQLLRPGIEKAAEVGSDPEATSYPLRSFLERFPVRMRDSEKNAPKDRPVWRMAAVRDFDVICDQAYGTFVYIDAVSGAALSKRQPACGVQVFMRHGLTPPSPIQPFVFPQGQGEIPLDSPAEQVGTFDPLVIAQKVESMDLGLRLMVRDNRPDEEVRANIDRMCAWWAKIEQVRKQDTARGITVLEDAARQDPKDRRKLLALFTRYVNEVEKEKKAAQASDKVVRIARGGNKSQFWLERQFEVSPECLGTRNQTHVVLDTRTNEWLYKLQDPPHTGVFSKYYRPALGTLQSALALGKEDLDLQREHTRLRWLVGGNGPAIGDGDSLNPIDALQIMAYAEYNRVRGSEKMLEAARLRLPKSWTETSKRDLGNGTVEVTTTTFTRNPTADELAAADRLDLVAKQKDAPLVAQVQDLALKVPVTNARIYYLWSRIEALFYDAQLADRIAVRGLMIDPGNAELHAARLMAWQTNKEVNGAEGYVIEKLSAPYTPADLQSGGSLAQHDPLSGYFLTLQRLRIDPQSVGAHAMLSDNLSFLSGILINKQEIMPDAREQRQRELGVVAQMLYRLLDRPNEWSKGVALGKQAPTRQSIVVNLITMLNVRGEELTKLRHNDQARVCYQKVLALDPNNQRAREGLQAASR